MEEKLIMDAAQRAMRLTETALKKAWSVMDAASEKDMPSKYLSPQTVEAIQGKTPGVKE